MRIAIDARLTFYSQAGISRYTQRLTSELISRARAVDWRVIQSRKDGRTLAEGCRINAWTPCHHRCERWTLAGELLPHRIDLLHSPDFIPPVAGARRFVITVHDLNFIHFPQLLTADSLRYYAGQISWAIKRADHILADSHQTRQDLLTLLDAPPEKVTTVHLAPNERFRPLEGPLESVQRYGLVPGYILFVGTLEPRKNIPTLLKAYRQLLDRKTVNVPLVLVGRWGWLADEIRDALETHKLGEQVRLLTDVSGLDALVELYNGAGVLAIPSFYEGFGLPALEAMACGTPVVAAERGSLPEIVADAGLLVDPRDVDGLADAIASALKDERLRVGMIENGKRQAARFSWFETARQTWQVYRQILPELEFDLL